MDVEGSMTSPVNVPSMPVRDEMEYWVGDIVLRTDTGRFEILSSCLRNCNELISVGLRGSMHVQNLDDFLNRCMTIYIILIAQLLTLQCKPSAHGKAGNSPQVVAHQTSLFVRGVDGAQIVQC